MKFERHDISSVANRIMVFCALGVFIAAVYLLIVVGFGSGLEDPDGTPNLSLSIGATAVIALAFRPVEKRVKKLANRLTYGDRATPYEVMSDFSRRMSGAVSVDEILPRMARSAAQGLGATRSRVRVFVPAGEEIGTSWPPEDMSNEYDRCVDVRLRGDLVGQILVAKPPGETITPAEDELLEDLASQAGLALHNVRLAAELRERLEQITAQADELSESRRRIVTAQHIGRRRLQTSISTGPGLRLIAITELMDLAERTIAVDAEKTAALLDALVGEAGRTLESLRDLARGIFPPLLADKGVVAALRAHIRKSGLPVTLESDEMLADRRFEHAIETTLYFCCLEAISNIAQHAGGAPATVSLRFSGDAIAFSVQDEGPGFDPATTPWGLDLQLMGDRLAALGGSIDIRSARGEGTAVSGRLPVGAATAANHRATSAQASASR